MLKVGMFALIVFFIGIATEVHAMGKEWFQTWDRPEYLEWAMEIPEGYLLHIICKEQDAYLVVQAKLLMGAKGLPGFKVVEQFPVSDKQKALEHIEQWESEQLPVAKGN